MKTVFLLGAGASFGSEPDGIRRPPLGAKLFDELESKAGIAAGFPDDLKQLFRDDFEKGMAEFFIRYNGNTSEFQRDMAHHLSMFIPSESSCYLVLVALFARRDVTFVSLNYDLLLERAAINLGAGITYHNTKKAGFVNVLKIHGSSNFWPDFGTNIINVGGMWSSAVDVEAPIKCVNPSAVHINFAEHGGFAPAVAMYAEGKGVRVCPDYILGQQKMWLEDLEVADVLNVIGVRVHEVDTHIWEKIGVFKGVINYFGSDSDSPEYQSWRSKYPKLKSSFHKAYFSDALKFIVGEITAGRC